MLKGGRERSPRRAAALLGYSERQAQRWWRRYAAGGLEALLAERPRGGRRERITPAAWAALEAEMVAGRIGRLREARAYLRERFGIAYSLDAVSRLLKRRGVKLKTGRKRHRRADADARAAFKKAAQRRMGRATGPADLRPGWLNSGAVQPLRLRVWHRRRWCPRGVRPPWAHEDRYQWLWLYAAVEPTTGESVTLFLPRADGLRFEAFLQAFRRAVPDGAVALVLDGSGSHTSQQVAWPEGLEPLPLPAYSPELHPTERLFEALRRALANRVFGDLAALERALTEALQPYWGRPEALAQLTGYPWWRDSAQHITPS